jgi:hypothetical protein
MIHPLQAGDIAPRPRQALDPTGSDWIDSTRNHDWNLAGHLQQDWNNAAAAVTAGDRVATSKYLPDGTRFAGALVNLGHEACQQTMGNVNGCQDHGITVHAAA